MLFGENNSNIVFNLFAKTVGFKAILSSGLYLNSPDIRLGIISFSRL